VTYGRERAVNHSDRRQHGQGQGSRCGNPEGDGRARGSRHVAGRATEGWSPSEGLTMLFQRNPDGSYKGPGGRREVTIGKDPAAIAEARRLAENRRRWEACELAAWNLDNWIDGRWLKLLDLAEDCRRWPAFDLGPVAPAAAVTPGVKASR